MAGLLKVKRVVSAALGELPLTEAGGTFNPGGSTRETKRGEVAENTGFVETTMEASLVVTLNASIAPDLFAAIDNDTLSIQLTNGKEYSMAPAWVLEPPELGEGEFEVTYNAAKSVALS